MTASRYDLLIANGQAVTPGGIVPADIGVVGGRIVAIGAIDRTSAGEVFDARGLHVLPGVIDSQVHFREPGLEHKEDLATGTAGALLGGVTTVFEMPNTKPSTLTEDDLNDKLRRAKGRAWCDHAFFMGAADENAEKLGELEKLPGCCGVKVFMGSSTGSLLVSDDDTLLRVLKSGTRRVAIHAEDEPRLLARKEIAEKAGKPHAHHDWRDVESALLATRRILSLARRAGRRIHVLHISTADEMPLLAENKDIATVEVTPQHLTLAAPDCYDRLGNYAQMNPPVREARHREGLWRAVAQGIVDVLGSDHAPHTKDEKSKPYPQSPSGMPGVQTLLPIMLEHVHQGRLSLERLVDLTSTGAARIYGIAGKGRIVVGYDADFTLVDLNARRTITNKWIASKTGWTPFDGVEVTGWPIAAILRGRVAMRDDTLLGDAGGEPVRFVDTLPRQ